jgi:DNA-binding Lrp family transcriptional regulator
MSKWTILTHHGAVLMHVAAHERITALELAVRLGITERSVRRIVADLEADGYIRKEKAARVNRYTVSREMPLRHADFENIGVGELLKVMLRRPAD